MTANYANPAACYTVAILLPVLSILAVVWRFGLRIRRQSPIGVDDWLCLPALVFTIGCGIVIIIGTAQGAVGRHSSPQSIKQVEFEYIMQQTIIHKASYAFVILSYFALGFVKLSFMFFFRRIFRGRIFNIVSWVTIVAITLWMVLFGFIFLFTCNHHFDYIWGPLNNIEEHCLNIFDQNLAGSVFDVFFDLVIVILPMIMVLQLHMPVKHKLTVCSVFLVGALCIAAGVCRLVINIYLLFQNDPSHRSILGVAWSDEIGQSTLQLFWTMIEIGVGMVVVCMPSLRIGSVLHKTSSQLHRLLSKLSFSSARSSRKASAQSIPSTQMVDERSSSDTSSEHKQKSLRDSDSAEKDSATFRSAPNLGPLGLPPNNHKIELDATSLGPRELDGQTHSRQELDPATSRIESDATRQYVAEVMPQATTARVVRAPEPRDMV